MKNFEDIICTQKEGKQIEHWEGTVKTSLSLSLV